MDDLKQAMLISKEEYKTKASKKELFKEVKNRVRALEEEDSSYESISDEQIANIIFSGFNTKLNEFTLLFHPKFGTDKS
ncbi:MAG: hypothetical protein HRT88_17035 [Lentisphaeraceae bacterium]|nr:hypothetical protein [Lentisphaeraceae bacterium]